MAVFLNQERTKIGTTTGTLIAFPQELEVNDPNVGNSAELLPAGYLRCDGAVYQAEVFPELVTKDDNEMLAVNYQGLVPVLINALKEQQSEIDELKEMVQSLVSKE